MASSIQINKTSQEDTSEKKKKILSKHNSDNIIYQQTNVTNFTTSFESKNDKLIESQITQTKMNAFQLMMESRNKIIGMNPSGKEMLETVNSYDTDKKVKLANRKKIFNEWAELKGASKRKRKEQEQDELITIKMNKRSKRLKTLLKVENNCASIISKNISVESKKRVRKLSSDNEVEISDNLKNDKVDTLNKYKNSENISISNQKGEVIKKNRGDFKDQIDLQTNKGTNCTENLKIKSQCWNNECESFKNIFESNLSKNITFNCIDEEIKDLKIKKKKKCKKKRDMNHDELSKDNINDSNTSKSWKMKIKIKQDNSNIINIKDCSSEVSEIVGVMLDDEILDKDTINISSDEDEFEVKKTPIKSLKIAPIFAKVTPKPKLDPNVLEARRQFLLSGTPDLLKKKLEKQQSFDKKEVVVFPSISHVQQKCNNPYWYLRKPRIKLTDQPPMEINESFLLCRGLSARQMDPQINLRTEVEKVDKLKELLNKIKLNNPNYPVYKSFKFLYNIRSSNNRSKINDFVPSKKQKRKRKKNQDQDIEIIVPQEYEQDLKEFAMWTEKYRPKCSNDILGNSDAIKSLKKWLETWKNFSQEINSKKKRSNSSSSEFESTDYDSRNSDRLPGSTVVLGGCCGSGKSSAVYAICEELGFNVIEINASSKRTGKKLIQELHEATQSHQVRKTEPTLAIFVDSNKLEQKSETKDQGSEKKMCVLFVEDVDIVFEQDDGFIVSLIQLINTSKRPIILTTTNYNSSYVQKFFNDHEYIPFLPLSPDVLATWLQILCLVEGLLVDKNDISSLLNSNKGDIRKTILQLQFWVQSGGQLMQIKMPVKIVHSTEEVEEKFMDDDNTDILKYENKKDTKVVTHKDCIRSFQIFENQRSFFIPYYIDLGLIWWNIPNILDWPSLRTSKIKQQENIVAIQNELSQDIDCQLTKFYESLLFTDVMFKKLRYFDSSEPTVRNHISDITDSLELNERIEEIKFDLEFAHNITHTLIDGCIREISNTKCIQNRFNVGLPRKIEKRTRSQQHVSEDIFREGLCPFNYERKSFALDYFPMLRTISRLEINKVTSNTKRGNRFRSYFKDLGVNCSENTTKTIINMLQESEEEKSSSRLDEP